MENRKKEDAELTNLFRYVEDRYTSKEDRKWIVGKVRKELEILYLAGADVLTLYLISRHKTSTDLADIFLYLENVIVKNGKMYRL